MSITTELEKDIIQADNNGNLILEIGNVGIGTTDPKSGLDLFSDFHIGNINGYWSSTVGKGIYMKFGTGGLGEAGYIQSIDRSNATNKYPLEFTASKFGFAGGNVGIGTTSPGYRLQVDGYDPAQKSYSRWANSSGWHNSGATLYTAALYAGSIMAGDFIGISDLRIKKDIVSLPDESSLELFRSLNPVSYYYKDQVDNLKGKQYGFIAQEVENLVPDAINTQTDIPHYICDIDANVDNPVWEENSLVYDISFSECNNRFVRFYVSDNTNGSDEVKKEIEYVDGKFTFDKQYKNVYIYGRAVLDLKTVNYQILNTILFSATQEMDRNIKFLETENQELKEKIQGLETENNNKTLEITELKEKLQTMEADMALVKQKLGL